MAAQHTAMLPIPDLCRDAGLNVRVLDGWDTWEPGYYWTDEDGDHHQYDGDPIGGHVHHTATSEYTPNVVANGKTKANIYSGLARPGTSRLYSVGDGTPVVVFAASGPANYGNGGGWATVRSDYIALDREFPGPARNHSGATDNTYFNRNTIGWETVHLGDGSPLHAGVFELNAEVWAVLCEHFGWSPARLVGHEDSTTRKVDPKWEQGAPYTVAAVRSRVGEILNGGFPPPPPPPGGDMGTKFISAGQTDDREAREFYVEEAQAMLAVLAGSSWWKSNRTIIGEALGEASLGVWDEETAALCESLIGSSALGPNEDRKLRTIYWRTLVSEWPRLGARDDSQARSFPIESVQVDLAILDGGDPAGRNSDLVAAAGMTLGRYDGATKALLAKHAPGDGSALGPHQRRVLDQKLDD